MFDMSSSVGLPDIFKDADTGGDELCRLPHADPGVEITDGQHGKPERCGPGAKPLDQGLRKRSVAGKYGNIG